MSCSYKQTGRTLRPFASTNPWEPERTCTTSTSLRSNSDGPLSGVESRPRSVARWRKGTVAGLDRGVARSADADHVVVALASPEDQQAIVDEIVRWQARVDGRRRQRRPVHRDRAGRDLTAGVGF